MKTPLRHLWLPVDGLRRSRGEPKFHSVHITGEAASADIKAATEFPAVLKAVVTAGGDPLNLVFNVDKTGLFWKRLTSRTFISQEEK